MKRFWGWSTNSPVTASLGGIFLNDIQQEIEGLPKLDSLSRLTLRGLSEEIIQTEGLEEEGDTDDEMDELTIMVWDEGYEDE